MAIAPRRPPQLKGRIFRGRDAISAGLLTREDLRSRAWRKVFRGIYADARTAGSYRQRCLAAAWYLLPEQAAIAGRSAAWLYGVRLTRDDDPVEVLTPPKSRFGPVDGLRVHMADLPDEDLRVVDGARRTSPLRTCWDLASWLSLPEAVAYLDLMVAHRLTTVEAISRYARARAGRRGWRKLLRALALVDPAAESVQESRLRVRLVLAGLPKPVSQHVIEVAGRFVGRVDLAWPEQRVAVEYDGAWHGDPEQLPADRARLDRLVTTDGWIVLHVTGRRLREDFDGFLAELRSALRSRGVRR
ncbi:MAG: endonuclease domain-containing protein [Natronosporangium sp.]